MSGDGRDEPLADGGSDDADGSSSDGQASWQVPSQGGPLGFSGPVGPPGVPGPGAVADGFNARDQQGDSGRGPHPGRQGGGAGPVVPGPGAGADAVIDATGPLSDADSSVPSQREGREETPVSGPSTTPPAGAGPRGRPEGVPPQGGPGAVHPGDVDTLRFGTINPGTINPGTISSGTEGSGPDSSGTGGPETDSSGTGRSDTRGSSPAESGTGRSGTGSPRCGTFRTLRRTVGRTGRFGCRLDPSDAGRRQRCLRGVVPQALRRGAPLRTDLLPRQSHRRRSDGRGVRPHPAGGPPGRRTGAVGAGLSADHGATRRRLLEHVNQARTTGRRFRGFRGSGGSSLRGVRSRDHRTRRGCQSHARGRAVAGDAGVPEPAGALAGGSLAHHDRGGIPEPGRPALRADPQRHCCTGQSGPGGAQAGLSAGTCELLAHRRW